jgi:cytochrome c oxidase assembly protein subunit 15
MSAVTNAPPAPPSGAGEGEPTTTPSGRAPKWLRAIFIANLVAQTGIVLTGGLVRLTGSGLGCPTWPECAPGSFVPTSTQEQAWHKYVEFGNRTLTFLLGILAIAAIVGAIIWARKLRRRTGISRRPIVLLAAIPLLGTIAQAILGGITVLTGLHPATVSAHFMVSAALIAFTLLLVVRSRESGDQPVTVLVAAPIRYLSRGIVGVAVVVLTIGTIVTGSGPHSGDADTTNRLPFDPRFVSWLHADSVLLFIGLIVGLAVALVVTKAPRGIRTRTWWLLGICLAQGAIGYVQYFTGLPWLIVLVHLAGACAVWLAVLTVHFSIRRRGPEIVAPAPAAPVSAAD